MTYQYHGWMSQGRIRIILKKIRSSEFGRVIDLSLIPDLMSCCWMVYETTEMLWLFALQSRAVMSVS